MSLTAEEALAKAKQLMGPATSPKSTLQDRRDFYTHLITLPSYPAKECKTFFGTLVGKFFAEFEDLQDDAIDALLDLCEDEDEKMRIIGIKALGPTARADPRWVRGNTGVLLQLLGSEPSELKVVRDTLDTLLSVSPADVFSVLAEDCRNPEGDTGASRRNILEYLNYQFTQQRFDLLERGQHPEVEHVFRTEFMSVVPLASASERRMIAAWVLPLSTVSGVNSTPATRGEFCRMLRGLALAQASTADMSGVLLMLRAFQEKVAKAGMKLDPRWPIAFVGGQGKGVVMLALGTSYPAKRLLESLKGCIAEAKVIWAKKGTEDFEELGSEVLIPEFVKAVVRFLLDIMPVHFQSDYFYKNGVLYEQFLHAVYELVICGRDRRKELISEKEARAFREKVLWAEKTEGRVAGVAYLAKEAVVWGPIAKYFTLLGNHALPIEKVIPSWDAPPAPPRTFTQSQHQHTTRMGRAPADAPLMGTGPAYPGVRPTGVPMGPSATTSVHTASTVRTAPYAVATGESTAPSRPSRQGGPSAMVVDRPATPPLPSLSASVQVSKNAGAEGNADVRMGSPPLSDEERRRRGEDAREEKGDRGRSNGYNHGSSGGRESSQAWGRDNHRERDPHPMPTRGGLDFPPHLAGPRKLADRLGGIASVSAPPSAGDSVVTATVPAGPAAAGVGAGGLSIIGGGRKRQREREEEEEMERRGKTNGKGREREWYSRQGEKDTNDEVAPSSLPRLGSRATGGPAVPTSTSASPAPSGLEALPPTPVQTLRNRIGPSAKADTGAVDKANALPSPFDAPVAPPAAPPAAPQSISIRNRSKVAASTLASTPFSSVPAPASVPAPTPVDDGRIASGPKEDDGEGVVRKGRGFMSEEEKERQTMFEMPNLSNQQQVLSQQQQHFQQLSGRGNGMSIRGGMKGFRGISRGNQNFSAHWGRHH